MNKHSHLSMDNDPNDSAIFLHDFEVMINLFLAQSILPFLATLSESLLLGLIPLQRQTEIIETIFI